ncbi:hypothetical protein BJ508DRAFT_365720 [Ascobolus immersus RN42]|uniref:F-box domain-containing protein n=1 Tax=Ascobolus immersus RN42 TaxID=1160509 RepID=A0A3N4HNG8_ASCIM|nr:hypothetical protein BJ508DRAFT_365720 [Ascobolus immersus RN42]
MDGLQQSLAQMHLTTTVNSESPTSSCDIVRQSIFHLLPIEILWIVYDYLPRKGLLNLAKTCRLLSSTIIVQYSAQQQRIPCRPKDRARISRRQVYRTLLVEEKDELALFIKKAGFQDGVRPDGAALEASLEFAAPVRLACSQCLLLRPFYYFTLENCKYHRFRRKNQTARLRTRRCIPCIIKSKAFPTINQEHFEGLYGKYHWKLQPHPFLFGASPIKITTVVSPLEPFMVCIFCGDLISTTINCHSLSAGVSGAYNNHPHNAREPVNPESDRMVKVTGRHHCPEGQRVLIEHNWREGDRFRLDVAIGGNHDKHFYEFWERCFIKDPFCYCWRAEAADRAIHGYMAHGKWRPSYPGIGRWTPSGSVSGSCCATSTRCACESHRAVAKSAFKRDLNAETKEEGIADGAATKQSSRMRALCTDPRCCLQRFTEPERWDDKGISFNAVLQQIQDVENRGEWKLMASVGWNDSLWSEAHERKQRPSNNFDNGKCFAGIWEIDGKLCSLEDPSLLPELHDKIRDHGGEVLPVPVMYPPLLQFTGVSDEVAKEIEGREGVVAFRTVQKAG